MVNNFEQHVVLGAGFAAWDHIKTLCNEKHVFKQKFRSK